MVTFLTFLTKKFQRPFINNYESIQIRHLRRLAMDIKRPFNYGIMVTLLIFLRKKFKRSFNLFKLDICADFRIILGSSKVQVLFDYK